jgi:colanic acid biosynthesis glycosyl transferase WcaI
MRILLVTPYYTPDLGPSAPLFSMLGAGLAQRGHDVTVVTCVPHYPSGQVPTEFRGLGVRRSIEDGVAVLRVPVPSVQRARLAQRLLQYLAYQAGAAWTGRSLQYDALIVANPGLWTALPFAVLSTGRHKPAIFSVHDVYPDVGIALGIFRHKPVIAGVAALERFCLDHAAAVRILSESFRAGVHALGVSDDKITLIYDWVDTEFIKPLARDNRFAAEHDLAAKFVVLYAGNLGLSQGLEHILKAAELLADQPEVTFVFVGDGSGRERLVAAAAQSNLRNVLFLPFQPRARLPEVLATASVSLISLQRGIGSGSLPSKTFSILASGRPILASVDEMSETWKLVLRAEAGLCVPPESPGDLAQAIVALLQDPWRCRQLGQNGRSWAERYHSAQSAAAQFEQLIVCAVTAQQSHLHREALA